MFFCNKLAKIEGPAIEPEMCQVDSQEKNVADLMHGSAYMVPLWWVRNIIFIQVLPSNDLPHQRGTVVGS